MQSGTVCHQIWLLISDYSSPITHLNNLPTFKLYRCAFLWWPTTFLYFRFLTMWMTLHSLTTVYNIMQYLFQRLLMVVQRGNAIAFKSTFPTDNFWGIIPNKLSFLVPTGFVLVSLNKNIIISFPTIAVENAGVLNSYAVNFLNALGLRISSSSGKKRESLFPFQRISITMQRFNAILLQNCFVRDGHSSCF